MQDSNATEKLWFSNALHSCFGTDLSIPYAVFLKVFAAPMCVPWNRNYGKASGLRKSGAAASTQKRGPEEVYPLQRKLLKDYISYIPQWESDLSQLKIRMQYLSDDLVKAFLSQEKGYADKHHNHKAQNYLSFFLQARQESESSCREAFRLTVEFYTQALEKLLHLTSLRPANRLEVMKSTFLNSLSGQNPRLPSGGSELAQMGWYMAALLLLGAVESRLTPESNALAEFLLGITLLEEGRTISVPTISKITLQRGPFCSVLGAALRAELELEEIQAFYRLFQQLRQLSEGQLDMELGLLLERFLEAMNRFGQRRSRELAEAWNDSHALEQIQEMKEIYNVCQGWLN